MSKITDYISGIGENPKFIAFMAHAGVACSVLLMLKASWTAAVVMLGLAFIKEFWYDLRYETAPVQTIEDSFWDFVGYCTGIYAAVLYYHP